MLMLKKTEWEIQKTSEDSHKKKPKKNLTKS